jgi:hypothetical protein
MSIPLTSLCGETRANTPFTPMPKQPFCTSTSIMAPNARSLRMSLNGRSTSDSMPRTVALPSMEVAQRYGATVTVHRSVAGSSADWPTAGDAAPSASAIANLDTQVLNTVDWLPMPPPTPHCCHPPAAARSSLASW